MTIINKGRYPWSMASSQKATSSIKVGGTPGDGGVRGDERDGEDSSTLEKRATSSLSPLPLHSTRSSFLIFCSFLLLSSLQSPGSSFAANVTSAKSGNWSEATTRNGVERLRLFLGGRF